MSSDNFQHTAAEADDAVGFVREPGTLVQIPGLLQVVKEDLDDDKFLETAEAAGAKLIVSGD